MCTSLVRRHIFQSRPGDLLTTREFLSFGTRSAVDKALQRCVKRGIIARLARGVFTREPVMTMPTALEIATVKAKAFAKRVVRHAADLLTQINLVEHAKDDANFYINGRSSSFAYNNKRIYLTEICQRKIHLDESKAGQAIRAWWYLGKDVCNSWHVATAISGRFNRLELADLRDSGPWMPSWLCQLVRVRPRIHLDHGRAIIQPPYGFAK